MHRVLVSDPISEVGLAPLRAEAGIEVDVRTGLTAEQLKSVIGGYDALLVRSETKVTADVLSAAHRLQIIGRAGVGVDNIDVKSATEHGVVVVNSPDGNTLAAAELTVGLILALMRNIPAANATMLAGKWDRKKFTGSELSGKTVGIVGLGRIGYAVAQRLRGFQVKLIAYNPFVPEETTRQLGVEPISLDDLLRQSDIITVHTPLSPETRGLIGPKQFEIIKPGVRIVNVARGGIIDEQALADCVRDGRVAGFAFDVFTTEPPAPDNPLLGIEKSVITPHLGASTHEAQIKVAVDVAEQVVDVLAGRPARSAVNLPQMDADDLQKLAPYITLASRIGSLQSQLAHNTDGSDKKPVTAVEVVFSGEFSGLPTGPITRAVLKGLLTPLAEGSVNLVNAPYLAEMRGIKVVEQRREATPDHTCLLSVRAHLADGERTICGTVYNDVAHIVHIDGYHVDIVPSGNMVITQHTDRPGIIGKVGNLLGDNGINIAGMHVGREATGGRAIMVLMIDEEVPADLMEQIRRIPGMERARMVSL